jgi:hypothetical protein
MTQPVLNAYCLERQKRALESRAKSRAAGIDPKRAEQQAIRILENWNKTERADCEEPRFAQID